MSLFRDKKGITTRKTRYREPYTLYIIASEGTETEPVYFGYLQTYVTQHKKLNRIVKIETLNRKSKNDTASSAAHIIELLDDFKKTYDVKEGDELWLLIDRDRQPIANVATIAQKCKQKGYEFCLTSPCIEFWFLLHLKDFSEYSTEMQANFLKNDKVSSSRTARTLLEKEVSDVMVALGSGYNKSNVNMDIFFPLVEKAVQQAFDLKLEKDWIFNEFCTRIHILISRILRL